MRNYMENVINYDKNYDRNVKYKQVPDDLYIIQQYFWKQDASRDKLKSQKVMAAVIWL